MFVMRSTIDGIRGETGAIIKTAIQLGISAVRGLACGCLVMLEHLFSSCLHILGSMFRLRLSSVMYHPREI